MSFGSETTKNTTKGTTSTQLPGWLTSGAKSAANSALDFYKTPFQPYTDTRVAGFNDTQKNAFSGIADWAGTPQEDMGRVVDETGKLGSISDYINPYIEQSLQPGIKDIDRAAATERARIGDMAGNSNAFGDARHGVLEGTADSNRVEAIGDLSYGAHADAYNSAMGLRSGDLNRFTSDRDKELQNRWQQLAGLLSAGTLQQGNKQAQLDTKYEGYQAAQQSEYDKLAALMSVLNGVPYGTTTKSKTKSKEKTPDNTLASILGAAAGSIPV